METDSRKLTSASLSAQTPAAVLRLAEMEYRSHDHAKPARVRQLLLDHAEKPDPPHFIVDLSGVHYFGARFVAILVSAWKQLGERNQQLVLCGLTPYCAELIQMLGLHRLFAVYPTQRIALEEIERHVPSRDEETRATRKELRMDLRARVSQPPDRWYASGPAPCSRACCCK